MRRMWSAGAAALALLAGSAPGAWAAPGSGPVDVRAGLDTTESNSGPGVKFDMEISAVVVSGRVSHLGTRLTLPEGVTYVRAQPHDDAHGILNNNADCTVSTDGRNVTCVPNDGQTKVVSAWVVLQVGADQAVGTELPFTVRADAGDAVDTEPGNNTETRRIKLLEPADLSVAWRGPSGPVAPGERVDAGLVVTNHGPAHVSSISVGLDVLKDKWPSWPDECWPDPGSLICDLGRSLAPGESLTVPFTWGFSGKDIGTFRAPAGLTSVSSVDPDKSNDVATLVLTVAEPRPSDGRPPLALTAAAVAGAAVAVTGGALLLRRRARRSR